MTNHSANRIAVYPGIESDAAPAFRPRALVSLTQDVSLVHDVLETEGGRFELGPGRLAGPIDLERMVEALTGQLRHFGSSVGVLSQRILSVRPGAIAWLVPGGVRDMVFRVNEQRTRSLSVPWPTLIYHASGSRIRLAALTSDRSRPTDRTKLYEAPLMNVSLGGAVCLGSARTPQNPTLENLHEYERAIEATAFSHPNGPVIRGVAETAGAHMRFWKQLANTNEARFPRTALRPMRPRLGEWIGSCHVR